MDMLITAEEKYNAQVIRCEALLAKIVNNPQVALDHDLMKMFSNMHARFQRLKKNSDGLMPLLNDIAKANNEDGISTTAETFVREVICIIHI